MKKTPLENWIRSRILPRENGVLTGRHIEEYQREKLRELVGLVRQKSPFYRDLLSCSAAAGLGNLQDFSRLPFTTPEDLREHGLRLLCTSQDDIERVVTLQTSGTTGAAKRLFFTADDLELTVDFFRHGMMTMVAAGATVIIFLPGDLPGSVGDLLSKALDSIGVKPVVCGPIRDPAAARAEILKHESPCLVGIPTQILALARGKGGQAIPAGRVSSVLLSTDYVPAAIVKELERLWGCRVFTHYGMTETGLGGGVECEARDGYHLREADLYTEIVDPDSGRPVPDGRLGEVVFTTLTRQGMPLLRYRTGDLARILPDPCPCGTVLKRLGRVQGRIGCRLGLKNGRSIGMPDLDEIIYPIAGVLNYAAELSEHGGQDRLDLCLQVLEGGEERIAREAAAALRSRDPLAAMIGDGTLSLGSITFDPKGWFTSGTGKRQIADRRQNDANR